MELSFIIFPVMSIISLISSLVWSWWVYPRCKGLGWSLSALNQFTIGVFAAVVCMLMPVCASGVSWQTLDPGEMFVTGCYTVFFAIRDALRMFVLDLGIDEVTGQFPDPSLWSYRLLSLYASFLGVLAPLLTFTNVLDAFSDIMGMITIRLCVSRQMFIMSELSVQSITLASELVASGHRWQRPLIAFYDVYDQGKELDHELRQEAKRLNAICLRADVSHFRCRSSGKAVQIMLLGEDETEVLAQARTLIDRCKDLPREIGIFVYASSSHADHILDQMDKGQRCLHPEFRQLIMTRPDDVIRQEDARDLGVPMAGSFTVRRVDPVALLSRQVLTIKEHADLLQIYEMAKEDHTISVTIFGAGRYGLGFLKNAVWFYQRFGHKVEGNVIDLCKDDMDPEERFKAECPEFFIGGPSKGDDDAYVDIRFFKGVDCLGSSLEDRFRGEDQERLLRTKLVFIALGDDDANIQAAMNVRGLFKRLPVGEREPFIYAVIYDDQKISYLDTDHLDGGLRDHKGRSFHIRFIGTLASQYSCAALRQMQELEKEAFYYHLDWARKEGQLYLDYIEGGGASPTSEQAAFREEMDLEAAARGEEVCWDESGILLESDKRQQTDKDNKRLSIDSAILLEKADSYMRCAYFRESSIAKAMHKRAMARSCGNGKVHLHTCACEECVERRITEHMRWNAYMRANGYRHGSKTDHIGKTHMDLQPWSQIPCRERYKD